METLSWFNALLLASNGTDMPAKPVPVMDLSKIDFEALRSRFKESKQKNTDLEVLKATIRAMLEWLISLNKTRAPRRSTAPKNVPRSKRWPRCC